MYSMVLMMALSGTAQTPAGQWVESTGCCGGTPTVSYGCDGGHPGLFKRFFHHKETYSCFGGPYAPAVTPLPIAPVKPLPQAEPLPAPKEKEKKEAASAAPARIRVDLPADAKLYVDEAETRSTSARRSFVTPPLDPGFSYSYVLRAEVVRNGKTHTDVKVISARAGEEAQASFADLVPGETSTTAVGR